MPTDPTTDSARASALGDPSGDGAAPLGPQGPASQGPAPHRYRRRARRVGLGAAGLILLAVVVLVGVLVFLQTGTGRGYARGLVVQQIANVFADDAEISAESLSGNFLTGAQLTGLEIRRGGELVIAVDTVMVDYNLRTLLRKTFSASQLYVGRPRVYIRQRADSTFNVTGLFKPSDDREPGTFTVQLDEVAVRRGLAQVFWLRDDGRDSVHTVAGLDAIVRDFRQQGDSLSGDIQAMSFVARAPFDRAEARIRGAGRFSKQNLVLRDLDVVSRAGTELTGDARLTFSSDGTLPVFDALIVADPFALEDARAFTGLAVYGDPRVRLRADSDGDVLKASLSGTLADATVSLDGEFSRDPDGPVRYQAEGTLRRFDPSVLTRNPALAADVTGDLRLNLQGTTLRTLSGPFSIDLQESRVGGRQIDRLALAGAFSAGRVTFDLDGALPGASLTAEGRARPFDEVPTFQVAGTARDLDLGLLLPGSGRTDSFAGDFAVEGQGVTLDDFRGTVALDLSRVDLGLTNRRLRFDALQADAVVNRGDVTFGADATLPAGNGRIVADGTLTLGQPLRYDIRQGQAYGLNLAALTGNPAQESDLTGAFTLSGEGVDVRQAPIDLTAQLQGSRYGTYTLAAGDLDIQLRGGVAQIDADLDLGAGGQLTAVGTARPFQQPLVFDLRGTMQNLDLAEVQGLPERASDLTGSYVASGAGLDPATMALDAQVRITEPGFYGTRRVDAADLAVTLDRGFLTVDGTLDTPEGAFDLAFSGRPFDGSPAYAFDGTCFRDLDLSDFSETAPRTDLTGCFSGRLSGLGDLPTADASGVLTLRPSRINEAEIDDGRIQFTLSGGALGGTADLDLANVDGASGRVVTAFQGRPFADTPTYALRGRTEALDVGQLLDLPPDTPIQLSLAFDLAGRGTDPETMTLDGTVEGFGSRLGPVSVDTLSARFALANGIVRLDTLLLDSDLARVDGGGTLALFNERAASDFRLTGSIASLEPIRELLPDSLRQQTLGLETGTLALSARAEPGAPLQILATAQARQLVVGETAVTGLDANVNMSWDRARADSLGLGALDGSAVASFDVLATPRFKVERGQAEIRAEGGEFVVDGRVIVDDRRELAVSARVDPRAEGIAVERGTLLLDGTTWRLLQPTQVIVDGPVIDVRGLLLASDSGGQQVAVDGVIDLEGEQNLIVTVENLAIETLSDLAGLDALGGDLSADLVLSGPARAPLIDGTVRIDDLTSRDVTVGALRADVDYAAGQLALDATLTHVSGETLTIDGIVPMQFTLDGGNQPVDDDAEVTLRARADAFPIGWARPFLDDRTYTALGGTLRLDLTIAGTQTAPRLDGIATLTDGSLGLAATGLTYAPISADLTFQNDRIVIEDARVLDENGRTALDITGRIQLPELSVGALDLTIVPREFVAMDTRTFQDLTLDRGSSPLRLTGTLDRPVLRGSVVLASGDIYLTDELVPPDLEAVTLTDAQLREVEARFGRTIVARDTAVNRFTDALDYDLTVEIRRNVWLRSNNGLPFDVEFEGNLEARKRAYAESSQLFGQVDLVRGSVETLNRQFDIDRGRIVFNGDPLGATVDLAAELDVKLAGTIAGQSSATITLGVTGRFNEDLAIRFSANPAMEQADIVSLIATGRLADDLFGASAATGLASGVALGRASSILEGAASRGLGLETAQIDYEGGDLVIKVGDYLSSRVFWTAGVIVPLGGVEQGQGGLPIVLGLDYQLLQWLSAQTEYSGQRGLGGGVGLERAW